MEPDGPEIAADAIARDPFAGPYPACRADEMLKGFQASEGDFFGRKDRPPL